MTCFVQKFDVYVLCEPVSLLDVKLCAMTEMNSLTFGQGAEQQSMSVFFCPSYHMGELVGLERRIRVMDESLEYKVGSRLGSTTIDRKVVLTRLDVDQREVVCQVRMVAPQSDIALAVQRSDARLMQNQQASQQSQIPCPERRHTMKFLVLKKICILYMLVCPEVIHWYNIGSKSQYLQLRDVC